MSTTSTFSFFTLPLRSLHKAPITRQDRFRRWSKQHGWVCARGRWWPFGPSIHKQPKWVGGDLRIWPQDSTQRKEALWICFRWLCSSGVRHGRGPGVGMARVWSCFTTPCSATDDGFDRDSCFCCVPRFRNYWIVEQLLSLLFFVLSHYCANIIQCISKHSLFSHSKLIYTDIEAQLKRNAVKDKSGTDIGLSS